MADFVDGDSIKVHLAGIDAVCRIEIEGERGVEADRRRRAEARFGTRVGVGRNLSDGAQKSRFLVQAGASHTLLHPRLAAKLGYAVAQAPKLQLDTAQGPRTARLLRLASVEVQGARAEHVEVVVTEALPPGVEGLLGGSFLSRFDTQVDRAQGRMVLSARRQAQAATTGAR